LKDIFLYLKYICFYLIIAIKFLLQYMHKTVKLKTW